MSMNHLKLNLLFFCVILLLSVQNLFSNVRLFEAINKKNFNGVRYCMINGADISFLDSLDINAQVYSVLLNDIAVRFMDFRDYAESEILFLESMKLKTKDSSVNPSEKTITLSNLGKLYELTGEYEKAEAIYSELSEIKKNNNGENHVDYGGQLYKLAWIYQKLGKYSVAEKLYLNSMKIYKDTFGENTIGFANQLYNLADLYYLTKRYNEAERNLIHGLKIEKNIYENINWHVNKLNNLSFIYMDNEHFIEAEKTLQEALHISKKNLDTIGYKQTLKNTALMYLKKNDYLKAESFFKQAKQISGKSLDETLVDYENLGVLYQIMGKYEKCEYIYNITSSIYRNFMRYDFKDLSEDERLIKWNKLKCYFEVFFLSFAFDSYLQHSEIATFAYDNTVLSKSFILTTSSHIQKSILQGNDSVLINKWHKIQKMKNEIDKLTKKSGSDKIDIMLLDAKKSI